MPTDGIKNRNLSSIASALSMANETECQLPEVGSFNDVYIRSKYSLTKIPQSYRLSRKSKKSFDVIFNIGFSQSYENEDQDPVLDTELTKKWKEKAKDCLSKVNGKAKGPDGEEVHFSIYEGLQSESAPPLRIISVKKEGRANSEEWNEEIDCSTIFHELLHLTGLVDEYRENSKGYVKNKTTGKWKRVDKNPEKLAYDCRKIYEDDSIMASHEQGWIKALPHWEMHVDYCVCSESGGCTEFFENQKKKIQELQSQLSTDLSWAQQASVNQK